MNRIFVMTLGLFLIFLGVQVFMVKSYILTPEASRFVNERLEEPDRAINTSPYNNYNQSPFNQASFYQSSYQLSSSSYGFTQRSLTPPTWLCWPILFFGAVMFLHGLVLRTD